MKLFVFSTIAFLALSACKEDETISGYADADVTWVLAELDGAAFPGKATISFPAEGRIKGRAPCNGFSGVQSAPYPWFKVEQIRSTQMACPELQLERSFFAGLRRASLVEVVGDTLILSDDAGFQMVFRAEG